MKTALVGYTGFVGANLQASHDFTDHYNSKNIQNAYGTEPELMVYAGLPSAMFKVNANPDADFADILQAIENIKAIKAKRVVLISTVAVYDQTVNVDETHSIDEEKLLPYGKNRLYLERWVSENCEDSLIVRLPAIYGKNLKKNFIYDYINVIPAMLNKKKYQELSAASALIPKAYVIGSDGFYHVTDAADVRKQLYDYFSKAGFNAIYFSDSRSIYQFYHLQRLWNDIQIALQNNIALLNIVTEPVSVGEVYRYLSDKPFCNELAKTPFNYDIRSRYAALFGGKDGYLLDRESVLIDLKKYVDEEIKRIWG